MTREEAITKFRQMWNIIAEIPEEKLILINPVAIKKYALREMGETTSLWHSCYLCEYSLLTKRTIACSGCIINWASGNYEFACEKSIGEYRLWVNAIESHDYAEAKRLAKIIANLPEVEQKGETI